MKFSIELYAEKPFFIKDESFMSISLRADGDILQNSLGKDYFKKGFMALSGRRIAGIGRICEYSIENLVTEMFQAKPGAFIFFQNNLSVLDLIIETDIILDPGLIRQSIGIRLINESGQQYDIPLARPDIKIYWEGRGFYSIPSRNIVLSKFFY